MESKADATQRELASIKNALDQAAIVAITDRAGTITHVNDKFCEISKYRRDELLGRNHRILNSGYHPKDFFTKMWKTIASGEVWVGELRNRAKDGSFYWVYTTIVPFLDEVEKPYQYVSIRFEITERKLAEEKLVLYACKLEQSNRELQDFASVAAHDLQEPLRKILTFGDRLQNKCGGMLPADGKDYLERMLSAAKRMRNLLDDLLTYSRVHTRAQAFKKVNLNQVVKEVLADLEVRLEQSAGKVKVDTLPELEADASQMHQLFQNLISNSLKFYRAGVPPEIHISANSNGPMCEIRVQDNGIGFDQKYEDRIFTIFQRLHGRSEFEGNGVGLAIVKRILERHSGKIEVKSQPQVGTTFLLRFPFAQETKA